MAKRVRKPKYVRPKSVPELSTNQCRRLGKTFRQIAANGNEDAIYRFVMEEFLHDWTPTCDLASSRTIATLLTHVLATRPRFRKGDAMLLTEVLIYNFPPAIGYSSTVFLLSTAQSEKVRYEVQLAIGWMFHVVAKDHWLRSRHFKRTLALIQPPGLEVLLTTMRVRRYKRR